MKMAKTLRVKVNVFIIYCFVGLIKEEELREKKGKMVEM
jgi:hypothetical protein